MEKFLGKMLSLQHSKGQRDNYILCQTHYMNCEKRKKVQCDGPVRNTVDLRTEQIASDSAQDLM